jgi:hypothetical protein
MNCIFQKKEIENVRALRVSTGTQYWAWSDSNFIILSDIKTIIGINGVSKNHSQLLLENITDDKSPVVLHTNKTGINSISFDGLSRVLLGDSGSNLIEFNFNIQTGEMIKRHVYQNIGIEDIECIAQLGHLAVLGGKPHDDFKYPNQCVQVFDLRNRRPAKYIHQTSAKYIMNSLQLWRKSNAELVLHVCGDRHDFSENNSSLVYNLSQAIKLNLISPSQGLSKEVAVIEMGKIK